MSRRERYEKRGKKDAKYSWLKTWQNANRPKCEERKEVLRKAKRETKWPAPRIGSLARWKVEERNDARQCFFTKPSERGNTDATGKKEVPETCKTFAGKKKTGIGGTERRLKRRGRAVEDLASEAVPVGPGHLRGRKIRHEMMKREGL